MLRPDPRSPHTSTIGGLVVSLLTVVALAGAGRPAHAEKQDARKHYDQATAAFGLGRYADAAVEYEAAFRLRPDPALLYNCAQSYRLAGNKTRAAELYRNYLRLYGQSSNAEDARRHLTDLERDLVAERAALTTPSEALAPSAASAGAAPVPGTAPPSTAPPTTPAPNLALAAPPAAEASPAVATAPQPTTDGEEPPLLRRPWFWAAVGAALVGGTVAILLVTKSDKDPTATLGTFPAN